MKYFFISLLILTASFSSAQNKNFYSDDNTFNGKNAWLFDSVLCSNDFEGRKSGLPGAEKANKYIASLFQSWGLKSKGENNSFIQKFPLLVTDEESVPELIIKNARRGEIKLSEGDDFTLFTNSGSGNIETDIIFAGYGLDDDCWSDYKNIDVKGKVVLIVGGSPQNKSCNLSEKDDRNHKYKIACDKGAAGILIWNAPGTRVIKGAAIREEYYNKNVPGAYVLDWVVRELFKGTGKSFDEINNKLKFETCSFNFNKKVVFNVKMKEIKNGFGENVIGLLEGKTKKDEYIIFGAHMDHLGKAANNYVYYGADDNGSGTALIMELARVLSKHKDLKRNVLFIGFGAEEQGLIGSNYFVNYPTVSKEKIAMLFNFDMVGVGDGSIGISGVETLRKYWEEFYNTLSSEDKSKIRTGRTGIGGTDHTGFKLGGIPALSSASNGMHKFYHVPDDTYDYVDPKVFHSVGGIVEKFALFIINYEGNIIHKHRNEKNFIDGCHTTDLNTGADILYCKNNNDIRNDLISGIKIKKFEINAGSKDFISEAGKFITLSENKNEYASFLFSPEELKYNIYNSKILLFPIVKNFNGSKDEFNILTKMNIKYFDYSEKMPAEKTIKTIKNSYLQFSAVDLKNIIDVKQNNIYIIKDEMSKLSKLEKLPDIFYVVDIKDAVDADELSSVFKKFGLKNVHADISGLLKKNENEAYELIKKLKLIGYSDDILRNIFGENFVGLF